MDATNGDDLVKTGFTIFRPGQPPEHGEVMWPRRGPNYETLRALVEPVTGEHLEHVSVLHNGKPADMFVNDTGQIDGLPRNEEATKIYRCNWLTQYPNTNPETLPDVVGPAVLFSRRVWF